MGWSAIKLGEVLKHRKGSINIVDDKEYKLCRVQLHRKGVLLREVIKGSEIRTKKQQVCKGGDFLVAEMDAKFGGYGFIPPELDGAIVSSHYFLFELDQNKIRPGYLEVVSQLNIIQSQIKAVGSTNYSAVRPANVLDWEIPITSIDNQIKIESLFKEANEGSNLLTTELSHQLSLVRKLRQQLFQDAVQGKLVRQNKNDEPASEFLKKIKAEKAKDKKYKELPAIKVEEIPFNLPDNWVWCRLGEICDEILGGFAFDSTRYSKEETQNQVIRLGNVKPNNLVLESNPVYIDDKYAKEAEKAEIANGDILITMTGTRAKRDYLFSLCINQTDVQRKKIFLNQRVGCFRFPNNLSKLYINAALKNRMILNPVFESSTGAANQANIGMSALKELLVPLPPLAEQHRIVEKLEELMQTCDEMEASIQVSKGQNEQLLQQVLREALKGD